MTTDQQDHIILGYLRSARASTTDPIRASTVAARTAIPLDAVRSSLERLAQAGLIEARFGDEQ